VSDIHCHHDALAAALASVENEIDEVWCAGDIVLQYRFCRLTTAMLREAGATAIQGNHDTMLLGPQGVNARARLGLDDQPELAWLGSLPQQLEVEVGGQKILVVHGSPWPPHSDYLGREHPKWRKADELGVDAVIFGHTHEPMVNSFGSTLVINPGSLGEPRQRDDPRRSFAILDTDTLDAEIRYLDVA
jgi:putative phosphoesterase